MSNTEPVKPTPPPKEKVRHRDWWGALFFLLIGTVGLLLGRLGHLWIRLDVFSQFGMQALLLTVASLLALVVPKYKGLSAAVFAVLFLAGYSLWPHVISSHGIVAANATPGNKILRVATFNSYILNNQIDDVEKTIREMSPDVMTIIEFGGNKAPVLDRLKTEYPYQFYCNADTECDFVILSKFPLYDMQARGLWEGASYTYGRLGPEWNNLMIFGVHTTRFPYSHAQLVQVQNFVKLAETFVGPKIVMGDFNSTPFSRINDMVAEGLDLQRLSYLPTWPATIGFPQLAIDHIFVSQGIVAASGEVIGDNAGSDHYPIEMAVSLPVN